ncbi:MAG: type II toxin-antitoxin system antitoxin SocA domain-containing protein [Patescibacteria group bacterium]
MIVIGGVAMIKQKLYPASLIAKYFIWKAAREGKGISNKKLQKLLYYAQAWNLVLNDKPLFKDNIEAWIHGPAIWSVYQEYKNFGFNDIVIDVKESEIADIKEKDVLDNVWGVYGKYDAQYLEVLTHAEEPWQKARESVDESSISRNVIPIGLIKSFYKKKLNHASHG